VRLTLMAKLSSMKKMAIWPPSAWARGLQEQEFVGPTLSFVRKADGIAKETGYRAEFAAIGAAAARLDGDDAE